MTHSTKNRFVGLDVHKNSIVIAVADEGRDDCAGGRRDSSRVEGLEKGAGKAGASFVGLLLLRSWAHGVRPGQNLDRRGLGLRRDRAILDSQEKRPADQDRSPRCHEAGQHHRAGERVAVFIPDEQTESIRDLERARGAAKKSEQVLRHQLSKFLLRHGKCFPCKTTWNSTHLAWIAKQTFDQPAQQYVLADGLAAVEAASLRVSQLTERLRELVQNWHQVPWSRPSRRCAVSSW